MGDEIKTRTNLSVLNKHNIFANIDVFLDCVYSEKLEFNETKREKYISALNQMQSNSIPILKEKIYIDFSSEKLLNFLFENNLICEEGMNINKKVSLIEMKEIESKIEAALDLIHFLNANLYNLFISLIGMIFVSKSGNFSSATTPTHLGIVFLNPEDSWDIIDYAEAIYHEFIHLSIFLEDMLHGIFIDVNEEQGNMPEVYLVLRGIKRPLDRSFHAAVVSIGIMHLYYMLKDINKSNMYMKDLEESIREMNTKIIFFNIPGKNILKNMSVFVENKDFRSIDYFLNPTESK